ncbi:hypothetical protein R1sor_023983 [Riccia sorocarpa]|uniref:DDE Tnp4 domain-containing protein n=1 Tax=Riccia sorocarpa TaxID=122646 RepID=A0ABD3GRD6_9MARC
MVNYTNRVMTALESAMGHEIAWPDRQERVVNSAHFAGLGFPGCIGPVICDQNKRVIYFFAGMSGSCHDLTCLRRSSLWGRLGSAQLFDNGQYLLGDSGYIPLDRLVCSYKRTAGDMDKVDFNTCVAHARVGNEHCIGILKARWHSLKEIRTQLRNPAENAYVIRWMRCCIILHNFLIWRRDEWSEDDHPIEVERDNDLGPPPQGARECSRRGLERRQAVQRWGALTFSTRQASPTSPDRQHSPESSPGGAPGTLSDHATRSGSPSSPDRGEPADNEPLTGFGSPMVPYPASEDDEKGAIEWAIKGLTSLGAADLTTIAKGKRPVLHRSSSESEEIRFARPDRVKRRVAATEDEAGGPVSQQAEIAHSWSQENCTAYQTAREQHKDGFLRCKSVQVLYDFGICTKDVINIDDSVQKNSPNHPFQAVHPRPFDPLQTAKKDENYLTKVLQPFLDKFRGHRGDGISYVEANWHQAQAQDPIACLANYWAPMDERDEDFLWSNCTAADRQKFMAKLHGHRIQRAGQKAMQFAMAGADQPSQTQDGAGPSNSSQTAATEIG